MADRATTPGEHVAALEARIGKLETEKHELASQLADQAERANAAIAAAHERAYWLDRWHVDLNELMRRPGAGKFRAAVRKAQSVVGRLRRIAGAFMR